MDAIDRLLEFRYQRIEAARARRMRYEWKTIGDLARTMRDLGEAVLCYQVTKERYGRDCPTLRRFEEYTRRMMETHEVRRQLANMTTMSKPVCVNGAKVRLFVSKHERARRYQVEMADGTVHQVRYSLDVNADISAEPMGNHREAVERVIELVMGVQA